MMISAEQRAEVGQAGFKGQIIVWVYPAKHVIQRFRRSLMRLTMQRQIFVCKDLEGANLTYRLAFVLVRACSLIAMWFLRRGAHRDFLHPHTCSLHFLDLIQTDISPFSLLFLTKSKRNTR